MRRRVAELLRGALAGEDTRQRLVCGALTDEVEAAGFDAFAGVPMPAQAKQRARAKPSPTVTASRRARERSGGDRGNEALARRCRAALARGPREREKLARDSLRSRPNAIGRGGATGSPAAHPRGAPRRSAAKSTSKDVVKGSFPGVARRATQLLEISGQRRNPVAVWPVTRTRAASPPRKWKGPVLSSSPASPAEIERRQHLLP